MNFNHEVTQFAPYTLNETPIALRRRKNEMVNFFKKWSESDFDELKQFNIEVRRRGSGFVENGYSEFFQFIEEGRIAGCPVDRLDELHIRHQNNFLAKYHPYKNLEVVRKSGRFNDVMVQESLHYIARKSPDEGFKVIDSLPNQPRYCIPRFVSGWACHNYSDALQWVQDSPELQSAILDIFEVQAELDWNAAEQKLRELPENLQSYAAVGMARHRIYDNPAACFEWLEKNHLYLLKPDLSEEVWKWQRTPPLLNLVHNKISDIFSPEIIHEVERLRVTHGSPPAHFDREIVDIWTYYDVCCETGELDTIFQEFASLPQSDERDDTLVYIASVRRSSSDPSFEVLMTLPEGLRKRCMTAAIKNHESTFNEPFPDPRFYEVV